MATAEERDLARRAWDRTTSGITGAAESLKPFRERFVRAITEDQPIGDLEDELVDRLAGGEWTWDWFEEWNKVFADWGQYPTGWPPLVPEPDPDQPYTEADRAEYRRAAVASLVMVTAAMVFFRDRRLARAYGFEKWTLAIGEDPVEQRVARDKQPAIVNGDYSSLPPFFPGDTTSMRPVNIPGPQDDARPAAGGEPGGEQEAAGAAAVAAVAAEAMVEAEIKAAEAADADGDGEDGDGEDGDGDAGDGGQGQ